MQPSSIIDAIEAIANPAMQAPWDKSGLQVASTRKDCDHLAVMLDPLPGQIEQAIDQKADFILAHHPLTLHPELPNHIDNYYKTLRILLLANTPLYSSHTSLDVNLDGPAGWLGRELGLENCQPLEKMVGQHNMGYGEIGSLPDPYPAEALIQKVMSKCDLQEAFMAGPEPGLLVEKVAYCGGSGASLAGIAADLGADIYITGDIKYHSALDAKIPVLDIGHHSYEEKMMKEFSKDLAQKLSEIKVTFFPAPSPFKLVKRI